MSKSEKNELIVLSRLWKSDCLCGAGYKRYVVLLGMYNNEVVK